MLFKRSYQEGVFYIYNESLSFTVQEKYLIATEIIRSITSGSHILHSSGEKQLTT